MRMRLRSISPRECSIWYVDPIDGEPRARRFISRGSYVYQPRQLLADLQVCERLAATGNTLMHDSTREPLAALIRREYRRMIRDAKRSPYYNP